MFSLANVFHFLAHEFAGLSRWRFALAGIATCSLNCFFFWHKYRCFEANRGRGRFDLVPGPTPSHINLSAFSSAEWSQEWRLVSR